MNRIVFTISDEKLDEWEAAAEMEGKAIQDERQYAPRPIYPRLEDWIIEIMSIYASDAIVDGQHLREEEVVPA